MKIFRKENLLDINSKGCVLALGNFDGVHKGHALLINSAKEYAVKNGLEFGIYTFSHHPKHSFSSNHNLLCTPEERLEIFESLGADFCYLESFDSVKDMSPECFVKYIVESFNCKCTFCGDNFSFGKMAVGNSKTLCELMSENGKNSVVVDAVKIDGIVVSSTYIRSLIQNGETEKAMEFLGRPYSIKSEIIHGQRLGNTLGFPTTNQTFPDDKIIPAYGVYACKVIIDSMQYSGVADVGVKPTVSGDERQILAETHIIDFDKDVYGKKSTLCLYKHLRTEKKFKSLSELRDNIKNDVEQTKNYFKDL